MINRQNMWFLTLFSLILILGVYYITLPSEIFSKNGIESVNKSIDVNVSENDKLVALRASRNEKISTVMNELLNLAKGKETYLEDKILNDFKIKSYIEINNDNIKVTISSSEHNNELANNIMRSIQEEFKDKKNIPIKFDK